MRVIPVLAVLLSLLAGLPPALADAETVTIGPALSGKWGAAGSCPNHETVPPLIYVECAFAVIENSTGVSGQAPADGTITTWRLAGFQGTARLLVFEETSGGRFTVVQESANVSEPCVSKSGICIPAETVYEFTTRLPIKKGQYIGVEGFSPENCNESPAGETCTFFGLGAGASKVFDKTPSKGTAATPDENGGGLLLNAVERTGAEQVAMSLSPAKITADGKAQSIATATVTEEGKPVSGDTIAFASTDGGEKVGAVTETSPGTYATTITASHTVGEATIIATDNSDPLQPSGRATLTQGAPTIEVSVTPTSMKADGRSTAAVKVKATGVNGEVVQGDDIAVTTTGPAAAGLVRDNGDGTYTTDVTAFHQPGKVTVTATDISTSPNVSASTSLKTVASKGEGRGKHKHRKKRKGKKKSKGKHKKRRRKSKGKKKGPHHARRKR